MNRRMLYLCFFVLLFLVFQSRNFLAQIHFIVSRYPLRYSGQSLEQKGYLIDGEFFRFIRACKEKIPEHSTLYCVRKNRSPVFTNAWSREEYFCSKLVYYLYPRKIFYLDSYPRKDFDGKIIEPKLFPFYLVYQ